MQDSDMVGDRPDKFAGSIIFIINMVKQGANQIRQIATLDCLVSNCTCHHTWYTLHTIYQIPYRTMSLWTKPNYTVALVSGLPGEIFISNQITFGGRWWWYALLRGGGPTRFPPAVVEESISILSTFPHFSFWHHFVKIGIQITAGNYSFIHFNTQFPFQNSSGHVTLLLTEKVNFTLVVSNRNSGYSSIVKIFTTHI